MRIAFLTPEFVTEPKFDGGLANYLARTVRHLRQFGHDPHVFVLSDKNQTFVWEGSPVHRVQPKSVRPMEWVKLSVVQRVSRNGMRLTRKILTGVSAFDEALKDLHGQKPFDVVQSSDLMACGLRLPRDRSYPLITRLSWCRSLCSEAERIPRTSDQRWGEWLEQLAIRRSDFCYAPSSVMADHVGRVLKVHVDVMHPPVGTVADATEDASVAAGLVSHPYLLFFGRICRIKGADLLLQAARSVLPKYPGLRLVLAGRENPEGLIGQCNLPSALADRVVHVRRLSHAQLFPVIRGAEAVVLPSRVDNFPNTCVEAMSVGKIVVCPRGVGFDDLIQDGVEGVMFDPSDVDGLSAAKCRVMDLSPAQRQPMVEATRRRVEALGPQRSIPKLVDYFQACIDAKCARRGAA